MAYDEQLAERVRALTGRDNLTERMMFGGIAFMLRGNMFCGIVKDELMVRVGPERYDDALAQPHARPMDFTGRAMRGMVYVSREGFGTDDALKRWVGQGLGFADSLPPK
jgi:TfoX/Sxy family transcriptional regulator of competence genes